MSQNAEVHICNLALGHVGDGSVIQSLTEESEAARKCRLHYHDTRDHMLEAHDWGFARRHKILALSGQPAPDLWLYAYARPADAQRILKVYGENHQMHREDPDRFELGYGDEGERLIFSDVYQARCRYTARITDATRYPQGFIHALSLKLAVNLVMPLTGSRELLGDLSQRAQMAYYEAIAMSEQQAERSHDDWEPAHLAARR